MDKIILIDGNSLINRAFYATPVLTAPDGTYTNAVYAFVNMLIKLIGERKPDYIMVAFDRKEPTFRHEMFSEYKGTRKPMPEELVPQIPLLKKVLGEIGIAMYEEAGIEADDIIGTLSKRKDWFSYIVTGDKDSFQLVSDNCSVLYTKRGISDVDEYTVDNFKEKLGIEPKEIVDLKALMGDSSDNIPGVKGIGEKTGLSLVKEYHSIEALYTNIDKVTGKTKEKLIEGKEWAEKSKILATIKTDADIPLDKNSCRFSFPFPAKSREIFSSLALNNLLKKNGIFEKTEDGEQKKEKVEKVFLADKNAVMSNIKTNKITLYIGDFISFYVGDGKEYVLKVKESFFDEGFDYDDLFDAVKYLVENEDNKIILYNKKQIKRDLNEKGVLLKAKTDDVMLLKYLTDYTGKEETAEEVFAVKSLDKTTPAYSLNLLYEELFEKADDNEKKIYNEIELPLSDVLFDMEEEGFKISAENLDEMSAYYTEKIAELSEKINTLAGEKINVNSPKQLAEFLYTKLGLKHGKKNKSGYSTNVDSLENLIDEHPVILLILEFRKYSKLLSTYIDGFRPLIDKKTGLVHTTFYQAQTSTGRLSSRKPNLQNIPVRSEEGKEIRKLFTARSSDRVLIDADYSQIELRLLAAFSGCAPLIEAFKSGRDAHAETAAKVFKVPVEEVTPFMRRSAKAVNFGIIYGISEYGLAENIGVKPKEAAQYIKNYFETYPEVKAYMDGNVKKAKECGYAVTMTGRKRYIREINSSNYNLRQFGERAAMNMPLQGSAADIIKIAMINVYTRLKKENLKSKLILQVHDELIVDAFKDEAEKVKKIVKEEMENAVKLSVPLTVSLSEAENWYDCK